jgi:prefoldin beta subunit
MDSETSEKIEELQVLEGNMQSLLMQKQSTQIESNEVENALSEVSNTKDEVYKILNGVMIKSSKDKVLRELQDKKKILDLRLSSISKQENLLDDKADKLRKIINEELAEKQKKGVKS